MKKTSVFSALPLFSKTSSTRPTTASVSMMRSALGGPDAALSVRVAGRQEAHDQTVPLAINLL